jgi:hypothetical protein
MPRPPPSPPPATCEAPPPPRPSSACAGGSRALLRCADAHASAVAIVGPALNVVARIIAADARLLEVVSNGTHTIPPRLLALHMDCPVLQVVVLTVVVSRLCECRTPRAAVKKTDLLPRLLRKVDRLPSTVPEARALHRLAERFAFELYTSVDGS